MVIDARAKINWTLDIIGVREDGYHLMDMLMQPVSLSDTVTLFPADDLSLTTGGFPLLKPDEHHLALRAARALKAFTGYPSGAAIHVHKRIPVGAGMGGGSADAAAVLYGLNALWNTGLTQAQLETLGCGLGADVPFCLRGGLTRTGGIGERLVSLPCPRLYWLVVIQPCRGLNTGEIFAAWNEETCIDRPDTDLAQEALTGGDPSRLFASLGNVLQPVSCGRRPGISEAIAALKDEGADAALMTGSGSAVFGVFPDASSARIAADAMKRRWRTVHLCHTELDSLVISDRKKANIL